MVLTYIPNHFRGTVFLYSPSFSFHLSILFILSHFPGIFMTEIYMSITFYSHTLLNLCISWGGSMDRDVQHLVQVTATVVQLISLATRTVIRMHESPHHIKAARNWPSSSANTWTHTYTLDSRMIQYAWWSKWARWAKLCIEVTIWQPLRWKCSTISSCHCYMSSSLYRVLRFCYRSTSL